MKVIFISAKQGGGKTTLTRHLLGLLPHARALRFAEPIYEMQDAVWDVLDGYGLLQREAKSSDLLQVLGDFARRRRSDIFVEALKVRVDALRSEGVRYLIIDDGRFENEFHALPEALTIRLECNRDIRKDRADRWRENEIHISEIALDSMSAGGFFHHYFDTRSTPVQQIAQQIVKSLSGEFVPMWPDHMFWMRYYHVFDLTKAPRILQLNADEGRRAYDLLNRKKYGAIGTQELMQGFEEIEMRLKLFSGSSANLK